MDDFLRESESGQSEVEENLSELGELSVVEELCDFMERLRIFDEFVEGFDGLLLLSNVSSEVEIYMSDVSENEDLCECIEERIDG